jgi:hypothetical protein
MPRCNEPAGTARTLPHPWQAQALALASALMGDHAIGRRCSLDDQSMIERLLTGRRG